MDWIRIWDMAPPYGPLVILAAFLYDWLTVE